MFHEVREERRRDIPISSFKIFGEERVMEGWVGGWVDGVKGSIRKTSVSRFKFQDGGGRRKVIALIVATDSRLWFKFQVSNLKARDFTAVLKHV